MGNEKVTQPERQAPESNGQEGAGKSIAAPAFELSAGPLQQQPDPAAKPETKPVAKPADAKPAAKAETKTDGKAAEKPKADTTKLIGAGTIKLTDKAAKEHTLTIKDGTLLEGSGKTAKSVGTIDGDGNYSVTFGEETLTGNISALDSTAVAGVSLTTKEGKKEVKSLEMNKDKVDEGTIYFDDGVYYIKNNILYYADGKKQAGTIRVVKESKDGKGERKVLYDFTDTTGKKQTGDLMKGDFATKTRKDGDMEMQPGEGSLIRMGKKMRGGRQRDLWMGLGGTTKKWLEMYKQGKGWEMSGGGQVKDALKRLKKDGKLEITDDQIDIMDALSAVESSGFLNVINSWDSDKMSMGFKQFTMAGKLQDLIGRAEDAFKKYGIELAKDDKGALKKGQIKGSGKDEVKAPWLKGMKSSDDLRNNVWATRFMEAGVDDTIVAEQTKKALEYLKDVLGAVDAKKPGASFFEKKMVVTILFELKNNRPAYLNPVIRSTQARLTKDTTEEKFHEILREEIVAIYKKNWKTHGNGSNEEEGGKKGGGLFDKIKAEF